MNANTLSDAGLVERLLSRAARERECTADVIEDLAEVDARKIYVTAGFSSLSKYVMAVLGYSEPEAFPRVAVARLVHRYPQALVLLRDGRASLSTSRLVGPHLDGANADKRLAAVVGRTVKEVEELIAAWAPKPDVPTTVTFIPAKEPQSLLHRMEAPTALHAPTNIEPGARPIAAEQVFAIERPASLPKPLSAGKRVIQITIDEDEYRELMRLRDLDRHAIPDGDIKKIIVAAVRQRLAKVESRKLGNLQRTKPVVLASSKTDNRRPTQSQKRAVVGRDGAQCAYVAPDGRRCDSTAWLEHDHVDGWSLTRETTVDALQLLCRAHNQAKGSRPNSLRNQRVAASEPSHGAAARREDS